MRLLLPLNILKSAKNRIRSLLNRCGYTVVKNDYNCSSLTRLDFVLKQALGKDGTSLVLFDVGANIGLTTIHFRSLFPQARIYCFEAVPDTCLSLASNLNQMEHVSWYNLGLGSSEQVCRVYLREDNQWNSLVPAINEYLGQDDGAAVDVVVTTIDRFMAKYAIDRIDLLKIDTEGYEMEVLKGAKGAFDRGVVQAVLLEVGFDRTQLQHSYYLDLFRYLDECGFRFQGLYQVSFDQRNNIDFANALFYKGSSF